MSDDTKILLALLAAVAICLTLIPLLGGAMLRLACKITGVAGVRYKRCWLAYLSAYAVASVVALPLYFVLPKTSSGPPTGAALGIMLLIALAIHAAIVPRVLGTPFKRTVGAHGLALLMTAAIFVAMSLPLVLMAKSQARRVDRIAQLKQLHRTMGFLSDVTMTQPGLSPAAIYSKDGKPLLSWRVALLPYMERETLYNQFHLDEPWDSPHNLTLVAQMPKEFGDGDEALDRTGKTRLRIFVSPPGARPTSPFILGDRKGVPLSRISDGPASTGIVFELAEPTVWTRPDEPQFVAGGPLPAMGNPDRDGKMYVLYADGSVRLHRVDQPSALWEGVITIDGQERQYPSE